jgi:hypothetical protein
VRPEARRATDRAWSRPVTPPSLSRAAWAWEFLRRNPHFVDALAGARSQFQEEDPIGRFRVFRAPELVGIGGSACLYASAAGEDAAHADVVWHPDIYAGVLKAFAIAVPIRGRMPLRLANLPLDGVVIRSGDTQHLLVRDGQLSLQLCVTGTDLRHPVHIFPQPEALPLRGAALRAWSLLLELERNDTLHPLICGRPRPAVRLSQVLTALDGWCAGVAQRQIAIALFGAARVAKEWRDPHDCLRDCVRRAIARGRQLSVAGYQRILATQRL